MFGTSLSVLKKMCGGQISGEHNLNNEYLKIFFKRINNSLIIQFLTGLSPTLCQSS